eukprot:GHRQ01001676.1.p2 GENE.GHRQ01001676.1~~GHRQ01001676.1.p2  ORF type:complete len:103 (+),score=17.69 GHRQ01001676.1:190-498(+)
MQAVRAFAANAGLLGRRQMTTAAQLASDAGKPKGSLLDTLGLYTMAPLSVIVFIYDVFIHPEEEFEGMIPPYPYLRLRTRETHPWGERGLFEVHRHIDEKPQ